MTGASLAQGWSVIKQGFRAAYDYAGTVMIISAIWFFLGLFPALLTGLVFLVSIGQPLMLMAYVIFGAVCSLLLGPLSAAAYSVCETILRGEDVQVREYFSHLTRHFKKAAAVTVVMWFILTVLALDVMFFWYSGSALLQVIGALFVYLIIFWFMMMQYVYPLVVQRGPKLLQTMKMAALLALDNIVVTLLVLLTTLLVMAVSIGLVAPIMLFLVGTLGFLHNATLTELLLKYRSAKEN